MLDNLKELVKINSYKNGDEIIEYLKERFSLFSEEIKTIGKFLFAVTRKFQ